MSIRTNYLPRKYGMFLDWLHIVLGALVVILAVLAFTDPVSNLALFPVIFFLAAVLHYISGYLMLRMYPHSRKKIISGILSLISGTVVLAIGVLSLLSVIRSPL